MKCSIIRVATFLTLVACACTSYQEEDAPVGLNIKRDELSFPQSGGGQSFTVSSGTKWDVSSLPSWITLSTINRSNISTYEWEVTLSASANDEYNREGKITIKSKSETVDVSVTQDGKKGKYVAVENVSLSPTELTLTEGESSSLAYSITPSNASIKDVTWKSDSPSVATVSQSGQVNAIAEGTTLITITTKDGNKTANCSVTVKPVSVRSVSLDKETLSLKIGETSTLIATVLPENAANKNVTWSSSNSSIAAVDSNGKVTGIGVGSAKITVTTEDGGKTAACSVIVNSISVTGVSLNKISLSLTIGGTEKLTATISPANATNKNVSWSSSDSSIATVDSNGNVSALKVGTAIITATTEDGGKKATCTVTVNPISVTGVSLNQTSLTMTVGDTQTLTATVTPSNATDKSVTWSSSNTSVATVSSSGVVTARAAGSATITVTTVDGGKKATCSVTVQAQTVSVTGVSLNKTSITMSEGDTETLIATVTPSNATDKSVTWSSNNTSVATVSSSGTVTAKSEGSATITVTTKDGGKTATCSVTVSKETVSVTGVSLNKTSLSMTVGDTQTLTATVTPSNATEKSVTWSSSNTSVATVSSSGVVTAKSEGSATITVTTKDGGKTATCTVTVKAQTVSVTGVSLDKTSLSMTVGDTQTLTATVTPSNATDKSVIWSSSNTSVATVSSSGIVTAKATGSATITVTTNDGGKKAACRVSVIEEYVDLGLPSGLKWATCNLGASTPEEYGDYYAWGETETKNDYSWGTYKWCNGTETSLTKYNGNSSFGAVDNKIVLEDNDDAGHVNLGGKWRMPTKEEWEELQTNCTWTWTTQNGVFGRLVSSKNGNSIFLPAAGWILPSGLGLVGIEGIYWSSSLHVENEKYARSLQFSSSITRGTYDMRETGLPIRPVFGNSTIISVTGVSLNKTSLSITVGDTQVLTATVTPSNATDKSVTWSSSNTSVATVSSSGVVTAKAAGTATITVTTTDGGKKATCSVTVQAQTVYVTGVSLSKTSLSMTAGDTQTLTATVTPSNATDKSVTWSSSNSSVVTVSSSGVVTAKAAGSATITVTTNDGGKKATCSVTVEKSTTGILNGHNYVEMGDGLKWATMNVGASLETDYGDYFAWGETEPKSKYSWSNYKYGTESSITKYVTSSDYGIIDNKTVLEAGDDAASVKWGGSWRMPTNEEWSTLRNTTNFTWTWGTKNGVKGYTVTSNIEGYVGNSIFLPAGGCYIGENLRDQNSGYYWSSTLYGSDSSKAWYFCPGYVSISQNGLARSCGYSVRAVSK